MYSVWTDKLTAVKNSIAWDANTRLKEVHTITIRWFFIFIKPKFNISQDGNIWCRESDQKKNKKGNSNHILKSKRFVTQT